MTQIHDYPFEESIKIYLSDPVIRTGDFQQKSFIVLYFPHKLAVIYCEFKGLETRTTFHP